MTSEIQSVLFLKSVWNLTKAKQWLRKHKFKTDLDEKPLRYRFRQINPKKFKYFRYKQVNHGLSFIIGFY